MARAWGRSGLLHV